MNQLVPVSHGVPSPGVVLWQLPNWNFSHCPRPQRHQQNRSWMGMGGWMDGYINLCMSLFSICLSIYHHLSSFIIIYHHLSSCIIIYRHLSSFIIIYHHLSSFIIIYHHLSSFIIIYHHLSSFIIIYRHLSSFIVIYRHLSSFIVIYHHLSSFIIIYRHLSSFIVIYHHLSVYFFNLIPTHSRARNCSKLWELRGALATRRRGASNDRRPNPGLRRLKFWRREKKTNETYPLIN